MSVKQVIEAFVDGATKGKAASVRIEDDTLFSYSTPIAERRITNGTVQYVTSDLRYSVTTSKQQTWLFGALGIAGFDRSPFAKDESVWVKG